MMLWTLARAVLVDVAVSDDVPVTSSKVVVAVVVGWLVRPVVPSFGVLVVVDKVYLAVVNSFSYSLRCFWLSSCLSSCR